MRGLSTAFLTGNVGKRISYGEANSEPSCSFDVASEGKSSVTWVRVNVYGPGLVKVCRNQLRQGSYVEIVGSLMNRRRQLEVRVEELIIINVAPTRAQSEPR